jgi:hypothetical protein
MLPIKAFSLQRVRGRVTNQGQTAAFKPVGRLRLVLPLTMSRETRFVDVATIKVGLGHPEEVMLRRDGSRWRPLSDDYLVDVWDDSVQYSLGPLVYLS